MRTTSARSSSISPTMSLFSSTAGIGSTHHLVGELLAKMADVKLLHVPFRGDAASLTWIAPRGLITVLLFLTAAETGAFGTFPFGALMLTFGVMFFLASKDPVKHRLLVDIGILRFGLGALAHIISIVGPAPYATFWLVHLIIDVVLLLLLLISRPKAALVAA